MGYRIRRVDSNQQEIVETFRKCGALVLLLHTQGHGCPDILIGVKNARRPGFLHLVEIKDGKKPKSAQKLTEDELRFHNEWGEFVSIVTSVEEAVDLVERVLRDDF